MQGSYFFFVYMQRYCPLKHFYCKFFPEPSLRLIGLKLHEKIDGSDEKSGVMDVKAALGWWGWGRSCAMALVWIGLGLGFDLGWKTKGQNV